MMLRLLLITLLCAWVVTPAWAQERILRYDSVVHIHRDGSLDVEESITVRAEGDQIRRGIYRDFPTRYRDRLKNTVVVDLDVLDVQRNGRPEPWFTETRRNGVRINTGDNSFLPVPSDHAYTLRFRTTRQLGFFKDHDELYWNAIGTGWVFPIEAGSVQVHLPEPVPEGDLRLDVYTGKMGARGQDATATIVAPGVVRWDLTRSLAPREAMTIALGFPKGLVQPPSQIQTLHWFLRDNRGVLVALAGLLVLLLFCGRRWYQVGRDPRAGTIITRYNPPQGFTPAAVRMLQRQKYDKRCFSAELVHLAVAGRLNIRRDPVRGLVSKRSRTDKWSLKKEAGSGEISEISPLASSLLDTLFQEKFEGPPQALIDNPLTRLVIPKPVRDTLKQGYRPDYVGRLPLDEKQASVFQRAESAHTRALADFLRPAYYTLNERSVVVASLIAVAGIALTIKSSGQSLPLLVGGIIVLKVLVVLAFIKLVRAPTPKGREVLDHIAGFKRYLSVAERDDLARLQGPGETAPELTPERYQQLLPYAMALEVEDAWTGKFTAAVGAAAAAAATAHMGWYRSSDGARGLSDMSSALGSGLTGSIAAASSSPGSSSGGGGGGSAGGGGGGGGGGGR